MMPRRRPLSLVRILVYNYALGIKGVDSRRNNRNLCHKCHESEELITEIASVLDQSQKLL